MSYVCPSLGLLSQCSHKIEIWCSKLGKTWKGKRCQAWQNLEGKELYPYSNQWDTLSTQDLSVLQGKQSSYDCKGMPSYIDLLHEGHPGILRGWRSWQRHIVWWAGINQDVEKRSKLLLMSVAPETASYRTTSHMGLASKTMGSLAHIDTARLVLGRMFLKVVDAHSIGSLNSSLS